MDIPAHRHGRVDGLHVALLHQHLLHVPTQRLQLALLQRLALLDLLIRCTFRTLRTRHTEEGHTVSVRGRDEGKVAVLTPGMVVQIDL